MLALIIKGNNEGQVVDLYNERACIYSDGNTEYTLSQFAELDTIEHELATKKKNVAQLTKEIEIIERYLADE